MKENARVLVALAAAVGGGGLIAASASPALLRAADAIAPAGTMWVNAIRMTVIPLVVSLLITGVASARDVTTIGRIGGRTLAVFGLLLAGAAVIVVPLRAAAVRAPAAAHHHRGAAAAPGRRGGGGRTTVVRRPEPDVWRLAARRSSRQIPSPLRPTARWCR